MVNKINDKMAKFKLENNPRTQPNKAPKIGPMYGITFVTPVTSPTKMANG